MKKKSAIAILFTILALIVIFAAISLSPGQRLRRAASNGDVKAVQRLVLSGTSVEARNDDGATPLMIASSGGQTDTVRELIRLGANVNATAHAGHGDTALYFAVLNDHADTVAVLLKAGADPNLKMGIYTPLVIAARKSSTPVVAALANSPTLQLDAQDEEGNTTLILGAKSDSPADRKLATLRLLIQRGCNPSLTNSKGESFCSIGCGDSQLRSVAELARCDCK